MKSKLTESQHSDICIKPISLQNKEWGDKNPPRTTQLNRKMKKKKKYKIPLTDKKRRRERFCSRSDRVDDEGEKGELLAKYHNIMNILT